MLTHSISCGCHKEKAFAGVKANRRLICFFPKEEEAQELEEEGFIEPDSDGAIKQNRCSKRCEGDSDLSLT